jgi:hypothetical protein
MSKRDSRKILVPAWFGEMYIDQTRTAYMSDGQLLEEIETTDKTLEAVVQQLVMRGFRDVVLLRHRENLALCEQIRAMASLVEMIRKELNEGGLLASRAKAS